MKRVGNLFPQIHTLETLRIAYWRAGIGKRTRRDARQFVDQLDANLRKLSGGIQTGQLPRGDYHQFMIRDPKERLITAPAFSERVLHHAILHVCEPVFERWLIDDTFACRRGRGRLKALERAAHFSRCFPCFLKLDIRKYFDSIPHAPLLARLQRLFKDRELLRLFERIVRLYRGDLGRGLPIGSLTSQHFANFYLGWFDRFVKERLQIRGYVRYMDDMVLWGNSSQELQQVHQTCRELLQDELQLELKPFHINSTSHGMDFLGCRVFSSHLELNRRSRRRFVRKLTQLEAQFLEGELDEQELQQRATALTAFARTPRLRSWQFRHRVLQRLPVSGPEARTA